MNSILFIAPSAYLYGGIATWLDYLVPGLEMSGWDVTVGLVHGHWHNAQAYAGKHPFRKWVAIPNKTGTQGGRVRSVYRTIEKIKPDIVVDVNIPDACIAVAQLRAAGKSAVRIVKTAHGINPGICGDIKGFAPFIDGVVATNKTLAALAEKYCVIEHSCVHYAPYGVEVPDKKIRQKQGGLLRILYVGRLDENFQKRVTDIPLIVKKLQGLGVKFEFKIAGSGSMEERLKSELADEISAKKVVFLGAIYGDELSKAYEWADVLLVTSSWETGPIVAWEAMARGLVVVSSAYVGLGLEGSLKDGENCLLFPVGDTDKAAECLGRVKETGLREKLSVNGYNMVMERYTRKISVGLLDKALQEILAAPQKERTSAVPRVSPAGRLDKMLGIVVAEDIRELLGLRFKHSEPGGEWPHTYSEKAQDDKEFWEIAQEFEKRASR